MGRRRKRSKKQIHRTVDDLKETRLFDNSTSAPSKIDGAFSKIDDSLIESDETFRAIAQKFQSPFAAHNQHNPHGDDDQDNQHGGDDDEDSFFDDASLQSDQENNDIDLHTTDPFKLLSTTKISKLIKYTTAELKAIAPRPDLVEPHDFNSPDPELLANMKAVRNSVAVPKHWNERGRYLQGKKGYEKPRFELPEFIQETGIQKIRDSYRQKMAKKSTKQLARDRMRAKLSKTDIDYQSLHDAFFKYQKKPNMTIYGDIYFEGKEYAMRMSHLKPGELTDKLKKALGMPKGAPPPWLFQMQKYGPPPSYPNLKIPGVNAPLPPGAEWGFHSGGWGRPPLDANGKPLYGGVFDKHIGENHELWGTMVQIESDEEEEEEEDEDEETRSDNVRVQRQTREYAPTQSEIDSKQGQSGKISIQQKTSNIPERPKELFTIVKEEKVQPGEQKGIMTSDHRYAIPESFQRQSSGVKTEFVRQEELSEDDLRKQQYQVEQEAKRSKYAASSEEVERTKSKNQKRKRQDREKKHKRFKM